MTTLNNSISSDRKIRLKNLLDKGNAIGDNVESEGTIETINAIKSIISESDVIIGEGNVGERAEHPAEVVMDAQLLKMSHQLVAKVMEAGTDFNDAIYQNAIAALVFRDDNENWNALTDIAIGICRASKFSASMLGSFEINTDETQKVIKERQQRKRTKNNADELEPESISQLEQQDKGAKKVEIVLKQISQEFEANNRLAIPFYKLVIDPSSFMNTIENAFQVSFLARDGSIAIETGEDNMPYVRVTNPDEKNLVAQTHQSVCSINLELCKEMIVYYDIHEAMLKTSLHQ